MYESVISVDLSSDVYNLTNGVCLCCFTVISITDEEATNLQSVRLISSSPSGYESLLRRDNLYTATTLSSVI